MTTPVLTTVCTALLASSEATALIVFNLHFWTTSKYTFTVKSEDVMVESDLSLSLSSCQIIPPLVLTTNTSFVGACTYHSATGITGSTLSTVLKKGGDFVVLQDTFYFNCIVTVQPINPSSAPDPAYPIGTLISCECHVSNNQNILKAN